MKSLRFLSILIFVALFSLFPFLSAGAGAQWCDTDPEVSLTQISGSPLVAHLTIGAAGERYLKNVEAAQVSTSLNITGLGIATKFTITVPGEGFSTRVILSSGENGAGIIYDYIEGVAGQPMVVSYLSLRVSSTWNAQYTGIGGSQCSYAGGYCEVGMCADYTQTVEVQFYTWRYGGPGYNHFYQQFGYSCSGHVDYYIWANQRVDAINVNCPGYCSNFQIWVTW